MKNVYKEMYKMLRDDLKKVQNRKKFLYKISRQFLNKMFLGEMNYIDYLNMIQIKKEIKNLDIEGQKIVREIVDGVIL